MRLKRSKRKIKLFSITSLIDVMFLLVIFLLLTAKFTPLSKIPVKLPKASQQPTVEEQAFTTITISAENELFVADAKTSCDEVVAKIDAIKAEKGPKHPLLIRCDEKADAGMLLQVTELLRRGGHTEFSFQCDDSNP